MLKVRGVLFLTQKIHPGRDPDSKYQTITSCKAQLVPRKAVTLLELLACVDSRKGFFFLHTTKRYTSYKL